MKKLFISIGITVLIIIIPAQGIYAQDPVALVIKEGIKKVIKAVDLKIQRLQNKTIWLQNAQKTVENVMSQTKLNEITEWVERQRTLYKDYYKELQKVKGMITYYKRIKEITEKQVHLAEEYKRAFGLFKQDKHFSANELSYMGRVYSGILDESVKNLAQVFLVIHSFATQMSDAKRIEIINAAADRIDINYNDMNAFNQQGILLSLQRAKAQKDVDAVKKLYGIQ